MNITDGKQLKAARAILGMTVRELAEVAGLNRNSVLRVEAHENLPRHAHAADRMAKAMEERGIVFVADKGLAGVLFAAAEKRGQKRSTKSRPEA